MIKNKLILLLVVGSALLLPGLVNAQGLTISIGDRPYATRGYRYWQGDREMVWIPGHRVNGVWVRGHYARGERRRHELRRDRRDWDRNDYRGEYREDYRR